MEYCRNCGNNIEAGQRVCSLCGTEVKAGSAAKVAVSKLKVGAIFGQSWRDIKGSKLWFLKLLLLGVLMAVPIVNLFVIGFVARGARDAAGGHGVGIGGPIFTGANISTGFAVFVVELLFGLVISLVALVPILGWAACIFGAPFIVLCVTRMVLVGGFSNAFKLGDVWKKYKKNLGKVMGITWLPMVILLVASLIAGIVAGIIGAGFIMGNAGSVVDLIAGAVTGSASSVSVSTVMGEVLASAGTSLVIMLIVCGLIEMTASMVVSIIVFRNFGYWTIGFAPDWAKKATSKKG